MKKKIVLLLVLTLAFSALLCGCKKDNTVKVTISSSSLSQKELDDLDAFAVANGFLSAKLNKDGTVSLVIDKTEHDKLLYSLGVSVIRNVYGIIDSEDYPYVKDIERNDDFTSMKIFVDRDEYEKSGDGNLCSIFVGNCCMVYLKYTEYKQQDKICTVTVADYKTKEEITKDVYPSSEE